MEFIIFHNYITDILTCDDVGDYYDIPDPNDCTKYIYCHLGPTNKSCAAGKIFNPTVSKIYYTDSLTKCVDLSGNTCAYRK